MQGYNLHGLRLNSKIQLLDYKNKSQYAAPHASLKYGKVKVPKQGLEDTFYSPFIIYNSLLYIHIIPSIAKYGIYNGNEVRIELLDATKKDAALFFFYDTILPILLIKNDFYPIQASAVLAENGIHLFSCRRGDGKSTLAASLCISGLKFISDDICILKWNKSKKQFESKCFYSKVHLWKSSIPIFRKNNQKVKAKFIRNGILKYKIDFEKYASRVYSKVISINILEVLNEDKEMSKVQLKGLDKLILSKKIIHSNKVAEIIAKDQTLFTYSGLIANNLQINKISRNNLTNHSEFSKFILNEILTRTTIPK